eukprot:1673-Heterococcus_DN1.PRE.1
MHIRAAVYAGKLLALIILRRPCSIKNERCSTFTYYRQQCRPQKCALRLQTQQLRRMYVFTRSRQLVLPVATGVVAQ